MRLVAGRISPSVENSRLSVHLDDDAPTASINVAVDQEAPKIVSLQPMVEMNLVKIRMAPVPLPKLRGSQQTNGCTPQKTSYCTSLAVQACGFEYISLS
jgi:hypothetical protein